MRAKECIESSDAVKAAGKRDLDDRQIRLCEQLFRQEQALSLSKLDGRNTKLRRTARRSCRVLVPKSWARRSNPLPSLRAPASIREPPPAPSANRIHRSVARSQLRSTGEARPESLLLSQCRVREKPASAGRGRPCGTYRPAIDSRGRDTDEEQAVETSVTCDQGSITCLVVDFHDLILAAVNDRIWPFSDFETEFVRTRPRVC